MINITGIKDGKTVFSHASGPEVAFFILVKHELAFGSLVTTIEEDRIVTVNGSQTTVFTGSVKALYEFLKSPVIDDLRIRLMLHLNETSDKSLDQLLDIVEDQCTFEEMINDLAV